MAVCRKCVPGSQKSRVLCTVGVECGVFRVRDGLAPFVARLLAGDLNDSHRWSGGGAAFPVLTNEFAIKSSTEGTLPGQPNETIDYILFDDNGQPSAVNFLETGVVKKLNFNGKVEDLDTVSDHFPVYLDIELK